MITVSTGAGFLPSTVLTFAETTSLEGPHQNFSKYLVARVPFNFGDSFECNSIRVSPRGAGKTYVFPRFTRNPDGNLRPNSRFFRRYNVVDHPWWCLKMSSRPKVAGSVDRLVLVQICSPQVGSLEGLINGCLCLVWRPHRRLFLSCFSCLELENRKCFLHPPED